MQVPPTAVKLTGETGPSGSELATASAHETAGCPEIGHAGRFAVAACLLAACGCSTLDRPTGGGFKSLVAEHVVRISMVEAFSKADFSAVQGSRFNVKVTGFAKDEVESYLAYIARVKAEEAGGLMDASLSEPLVQIEVAVHACGSDLVGSPSKVEVVWQNKRYLGETLVDLSFREAGGKLISRQTLHGVAAQRQSVFLSLFKDPGFYWVGQGLNLKLVDPEQYRIPAPPKPTSSGAFAFPTLPGFSSPQESPSNSHKPD